jgi:hypothetical protein
MSATEERTTGREASVGRVVRVISTSRTPASVFASASLNRQPGIPAPRPDHNSRRGRNDGTSNGWTLNRAPSETRCACDANDQRNGSPSGSTRCSENVGRSDRVTC